MGANARRRYGPRESYSPVDPVVVVAHQEHNWLARLIFWLQRRLI